MLENGAVETVPRVYDLTMPALLAGFPSIMASVSMIEARAYLGIDGTDHDIYLTGMRRESERRVRRLTIVGDMVDDTGVYTHQIPVRFAACSIDPDQMDV